MKRENSFPTFEKELQTMRQLNLHAVRKGLLLLVLALFSLSIPAALAQTNTTTTTQGGGGSAAQQQTSQREVTTTSTTHTQAATGIDPLWLILGGIALLAILLIVILAARGRSSNQTRVRERTTVIKD